MGAVLPVTQPCVIVLQVPPECRGTVHCNRISPASHHTRRMLTPSYLRRYLCTVPVRKRYSQRSTKGTERVIGNHLHGPAQPTLRTCVHRYNSNISIVLPRHPLERPLEIPHGDLSERVPIDLAVCSAVADVEVRLPRRQSRGRLS
jgi:hypothetical protein